MNASLIIARLEHRPRRRLVKSCSTRNNLEASPVYTYSSKQIDENTTAGLKVAEVCWASL